MKLSLAGLLLALILAGCASPVPPAIRADLPGVPSVSQVRAEGDLERVIGLGGHIRLCKGAYLEEPDVAFQGRDEVAMSFDRLLRTLMGQSATKPAIATHDDDWITRARELIEGYAAPYEFQLLYGVRGPLQRELVANGHPVRVYVPYGVAWYPYLTRRLAERPANVGFFLRAAVGRS